MRVGSTYRLQIERTFPLAAARALVPYLSRLGISHVYLSPLLRARRGSPHGYDVIDPSAIDPDRGSERDLEALATALHAAGIGLVLDVVPNHQSIGPGNRFFDDMLAHGPASPYARWFDVDWRVGQGRLTLPILGDPLPVLIERGHVRVVRDRDGWRVHYGEHRLPVDPATLAPLILRTLASPAGHDLSSTAREALSGVAAVLERLAPRRAPFVGRRSEAAGAALEALERAAPAGSAGTGALDTELGRLATPAGHGDLRRFLDAQAYRLVHWRRSGREINYRRFFNVTDLAAVRVEDAAVFTATHARILAWVAAGWVDGLRIDHVDGLADPAAYLSRLRAALGAAGAGNAPLWVEKVLAADERLRADWPVDGTTGYEFAVALDGVFHEPSGYEAIESWYRTEIAARAARGFTAIAHDARARVLRTWFGADLRRLARGLQALADDGAEAPLGVEVCRKAIAEVLIHLRVYRTYASPPTVQLDPEDRRVIEEALAGARTHGNVDDRALDRLARLLLGGPAATDATEKRRRSFVTRFQQASGPAMAKGIEDTAFFVWVPLVSRNEVGADPVAPLETAVATWHSFCRARAETLPRSLNCTTTHDTKHSADARARLASLTEIPDRWIAAVRRWRARHRPLRAKVGGRRFPDANTEYLFYQSLLAVWPATCRDTVPAGPERAAVRARVAAYMAKAVREAKLYTSWLAPDVVFERALAGFMAAVLADDGEGRSPFVDELHALASFADRAASWTSLARVLVHLTAPGVPDLYQGDELPFLALTDPDNRRPVDFAHRAAALDALASGTLGSPAELVASGRIDLLKLHVVTRALGARRRWTTCFADGAYEALDVEGSHATRVLAFARRGPDTTIVTIVPRCAVAVFGDDAPRGERWGDTRCRLPLAAGTPWIDVLGDGGVMPDAGGAIAVARALDPLPVSLLVSERR